ncbi:hypothetical protein AF335_01645 [Streptomyces eurocidicus]|uniref:Uncharacterized protein n=1 Tax=Streptomyces eurocidicus TaxID=66423 RepID=A0A2N8P280_STREU|nr:hypothetical protein [Streptomyces eurocidicus]MBB5121100.1 hypothetical protein [Streptomyces eurocidicus]MBF6054121.1 hypothetical protein [Streptomyces eurocidicus]PNE35122.1 hypothetical protein AF335_01645 [Streptomyces eurocidicus]
MKRTLPWLKALAVHEARVWRGLGLWVSGRRDGVGGGARGFGYARAQASTVYALLFVCVVETTGMSFFTAGHPGLHEVVLVLDLYTLLLVLGLHAGCVARPHTVGPDGLRLRHGARLDVRIPAHLIASVRRELRFPTGSAPADGVLDVPIAGQTSFTVELTEPLTVRRLLSRPVVVRTLHCHADDPAEAVAAVRALLPEPADA